MVRLLVDFTQMIYKSYFVNVQKEEIESFAFWRFLIIKQLLNLNKLFNPNEIVLACDTKSWRKEIFPEYKAGRIKNQSITNLFKEADIFMDELKRFPYKLLKINRAEADDIIATLVFNKKEDDIIYIISNDKDFIMLTKYNKVNLYNPDKEEFIEIPFTKDGKEFKTIGDWINYHVLYGDSSDNIPNIINDVFYSSKFVEFLGNKNIIKYCSGKKNEGLNDLQILEYKKNNIENFEDLKKEFVEKESKIINRSFSKKLKDELNEKGIDNWLSEQPYEVRNNYERNKKLIMLEKDIIPKEIQDDIMKSYNECKVIDNQKDKIKDFLEAYNMQSLYGQEKKFSLNYVEEKLYEDFF